MQCNIPLDNMGLTLTCFIVFQNIMLKYVFQSGIKSCSVGLDLFFYFYFFMLML